METQTTLSKEEYQYLKTIDTLNQTIDKITEKYTELQGTLKQQQVEYENKLTAHKNIITTTTANINKVEEKHKVELLDLKNQINALNSNFIAVRKLSDEKSADIRALSEKNKELENNLTEAEINNNDLNQLNNELEVDLLDLDKKNRQLTKELKDLTDYAGQLVVDKDRQIGELQKQLSEQTLSPENKIQDLLLKGDGYIHRTKLEQIPDAIFSEGGLIAKVGSIKLRRGFLRNDYTLVY